MIDTYSNIVSLAERLHRHFLDVLRVELHNLGVRDINSVQALLLANIGKEEVVIRDLKDRGYYFGSNVSYNIKKLTEYGYIDQQRSDQDKRAVILKLTDKGLELCNAVQGVQEYIAGDIGESQLSEEDFAVATKVLERLERTFSDYIRYGRK
ncbi:MAG: winged helix DNA-binding protein [Alphaproteobacteria bacterium]|nr:winged helix DNA-binding protein [Alphaproteobacteria bacterium]